MNALLLQLKNLLQKFLASLQKQPIPPAPIPPAPPVHASRIQEWANAIAVQEKGNPKFNNPGNLKLSTLTQSWGGKPAFQATDGGTICRFDTYEQGFAALCNFLNLACHDELKAFHVARNLRDFTEVYAHPPAGSHYAENVAIALKVDVNENISTFL
jgi:hypothetical protein